MKYEFIKIDEDTTQLKYKDKVFDIKKDVDLQVKIQSAIPKARMLMHRDLTKMGMTRKDLTIERHEGSKTYYDNTNAIEAEEMYTQLATQEVYDEIVKKYCDMTLSELMQDIGLDITKDTPENQQFGLDLTSALMGKKLESPRGEKSK